MKKLGLSILGVALLTVFSLTMESCSEAADAALGTTCIPVTGLTSSSCDYEACANASGSAWWELNGRKYTDVNAATDAYLACADN